MDTSDHMTPEQEAESLRKAAEYIRRITTFADGTVKLCPTCGNEITGVRCYLKLEPETFSLYIEPCDCRLGLWSKVPQWIVDDGLPITEIESSAW